MSSAMSGDNGVKLTTPIHLVPRYRIRGATPPLPQTAFKAWCSVKVQGQLFTFFESSRNNTDRKRELNNYYRIVKCTSKDFINSSLKLIIKTKVLIIILYVISMPK